jgi:hypothetical protein
MSRIIHALPKPAKGHACLRLKQFMAAMARALPRAQYLH